MPKTLSEVTREAAELPPEERLKLVRILLDLSDPSAVPAVEVEEAWDKEIEKRLRELQSGEVRGIPLEDFKRKIEKRFGS